MRRRWKKKPGFETFAAPVGPSSVAEALLRQRGVYGEELEPFLAPRYERDLHDPFLFRDMQKVVDRVRLARERAETVGVFGDFDADGITSSVVMREALEALGLPVFVYIPHKIREGHGLSGAAVEQFQAQGVRLIFTLDCGMMSHEEILRAKNEGIEVIVVDHHHVPEILPEALAIINPKLPNEQYPFRDLCGAGTSFKVATALYHAFLPERIDELKWLLDVVAIGTVADVMPLVGENRVFVKYGLIVLQKTRRLGLRALYTIGRLPIDDRHAPDARLIAFHIAPRINAASRMAHGKTAHDLLVVKDSDEAENLARELEGYNVARQKVSQGAAEAVRALALERYLDKKYILAIGEEFPLGVVGLVAGKIAHELGKPTGVFQRGTNTSTGSFRSIPGLSIIEALESCADLFEKYGGHEQAAGLTIQNDRFKDFEARLEAYIVEKLQHIETVPELDLDLALHPADLTLDLVHSLESLSPFGEGNPEPTFLLSDFRVVEARVVGKEGKHWKLTLGHAERSGFLDAVGWSLVSDFPTITPGERVTVAAQLSVNTWNGSTALQIKLIDMVRAE